MLIGRILRTDRLHLEMTEHVIVANLDILALRIILQDAEAAKTMVTAGRTHRQINQLVAADDSALLLLLRQRLVERVNSVVGISNEHHIHAFMATRVAIIWRFTV